MAVSANLDKSLDKAYESKSLEEILAASPAALAGVTDADAKHLEEAFGIKTVKQFGENKYFKIAAALAALGSAG